MKHGLFFFLLFLSFGAQAQYFYPVSNNTPYCDAGATTFLNNDAIRKVDFVDITTPSNTAAVVYTDNTLTQDTFDEYDQGLPFTTTNDNPNWNFMWAPPFSIFQYFTEVEKGATYPIDVEGKQTGGGTWLSPDRYVKVYVDWNQDGDFDDVDELAVTMGPETNNDNMYFNGNISIPVTALNGEQ